MDGLKHAGALLIVLLLTAISAVPVFAAETAESQDLSVVNTEEVLNSHANNAPVRAQKVLHKDIHDTLKKQGLSIQHIDLWSSEHPKSTLNKLDTLEPKLQKKVARVAAYIRKANKQISPKTAWREASAFVYYSAKYHVPVAIAVTIAQTESKFRPSASNGAGALGVMQVMWHIHRAMLTRKGIAPTKQHMFDPEHGVEAGIVLLSRYIKTFGTLENALHRYCSKRTARKYIAKFNKTSAELQK